MGRLLQTDPIGYGDGMNWYNYVGGDPVNGTDPMGLDCRTPSTGSCEVVVVTWEGGGGGGIGGSIPGLGASFDKSDSNDLKEGEVVVVNGKTKKQLCDQFTGALGEALTSAGKEIPRSLYFGKDGKTYANWRWNNMQALNFDLSHVERSLGQANAIGFAGGLVENYGFAGESASLIGFAIAPVAPEIGVPFALINGLAESEKDSRYKQSRILKNRINQLTFCEK